METRPWKVLKKGKLEIKKGEIGAFGGERPHISLWLDENKDTRVAIWLSDDNQIASYQITSNNYKIPTVSENINIDINKNININEDEDDDLPF